MYKEALQKKLRFKTNKGMITTEDLFDLSLQNLNTLAIMLDKKVSEAPKKSFIEELPATADDLAEFIFNSDYVDEVHTEKQIKKLSKISAIAIKYIKLLMK